VVDAASGETVGRVDDLQSFAVSLPAYGAMFLVLEAPEPEPEAEPESESEAEVDAEVG
jgi:hypothetical protein